MISRRDLLISAAALAACPPKFGEAQPMAVQARGKVGPRPAATGKYVCISSFNGMRATKRAMDMLKQGADTLDAVIAGVNIEELDPADFTVGYGGLPNEDCVVELDASCMHGPSRRCGAVAAVHACRTPSNLAKFIMDQTDHIMLVGEGADRFAVEAGFPAQTLLTDQSRLAWFVWKESLRDPEGHNNWGPGIDAPPGAKPLSMPPRKVPMAWLKTRFPHETEEMLAWAWGVAVRPPTGTINCLALNAKGEMSGVTTTSGLAWKIPGRAGDSPLIGSGVYVDQDVGAAGSTGRGEENIRIVGSHTIVENMRHGMTAQEAGLDALKRVSRNFNDDRERLKKIDINWYILRNDGTYAGVTLWKGQYPEGRFCINEGGESRIENSVWLMER